MIEGTNESFAVSIGFKNRVFELPEKENWFKIIHFLCFPLIKNVSHAGTSFSFLYSFFFF